jgi:predicted tellurium resistance membrane protein TerC
MLALLLPLPLLGAIALRRRRLELVSLAGTVVVTATFYSLYYITALHPRFLYVALPALFILIAVGVQLLLQRFASRPA